MFTMTSIVGRSLVAAVRGNLSPFFNLWVPDKVGLLYSPQMNDDRFFRIINDYGHDFRWEHAPWLGFLYSRQPINSNSGRRHTGTLHSRQERLADNTTTDRFFRFRTQVKTAFSFKFFSNDAATIERLEEHFIVGPFKKELVAQLSVGSETFDINFRLGYGGEDSDTEIGAFEQDSFGLVSTLTKTFYTTYPLIWFYQDADGNLLDVDPVTGSPVTRKTILNVHLRVYYKDEVSEPTLLFEEILS